MDKFILIPAFNPGNTLIKLVDEIQKLTDIPLLIVDDGSNPELKILNENVTIIRNQSNCGKGIALKNGFKWGEINGFKFAITIDADGQHSPREIMEFIILKNEIDFAIGYRNFSDNMPSHRRISNFLTSKLISMRISKNIIDSQCGYRRYRLDSLTKFNFRENGFQFETEVLLKIINKDTVISQIPIPTIYGDENSSIRNVYDTLKFISLYFRSFSW